jgi:hypothetical protein
MTTFCYVIYIFSLLVHNQRDRIPFQEVENEVKACWFKKCSQVIFTWLCVCYLDTLFSLHGKKAVSDPDIAAQEENARSTNSCIKSWPFYSKIEPANPVKRAKTIVISSCPIESAVIWKDCVPKEADI